MQGSVGHIELYLSINSVENRIAANKGLSVQIMASRRGSQLVYHPVASIS